MPQPKKPRAPWMPAEYDTADGFSVKALAAGTATPDQQKRALKWIIECACRTYDQTFYPGPDGARDSDFAQGRRSVGLEIVKMVNFPPELLRSKEHE